MLLFLHLLFLLLYFETVYKSRQFRNIPAIWLFLIYFLYYIDLSFAHSHDSWLFCVSLFECEQLGLYPSNLVEWRRLLTLHPVESTQELFIPLKCVWVKINFAGCFGGCAAITAQKLFIDYFIDKRWKTAACQMLCVYLTKNTFLAQVLIHHFRPDKPCELLNRTQFTPTHFFLRSFRRYVIITAAS